jgi:hypothetical protein
MISCKPLHIIWATVFCGGTRWRILLRHCSTSSKVVGSIPDGVIGIFHWHNPSGRAMAPCSTEPVTEMSTRNISWGNKDDRCLGLITLPPSRADCLEILGASTSWRSQVLSRPVMGLFYRLQCFICPGLNVTLDGARRRCLYCKEKSGSYKFFLTGELCQHFLPFFINTLQFFESLIKHMLCFK